MKNPYKTVVMASACFLLAACTGGSGGGSLNTSNTLTLVKPNIPTVRFDSIRVFSDGGGVGRGVSDGSQAVLISPNIIELVSNNVQPSQSDLNDITRQLNEIPEVGTTTTGTIHDGAITTQGVTANVYGVVDNQGDASFAHLDFGGGDILILAGGSAYGSAPSGEYTYQGTQSIGRRIPLVAGAPVAELGTFSLTANFGTKRFSYNGRSTNSAVSGSGIIDTVKGRFATTTLDITADGTDYTGSMNGLLHGNSSESVSGVFHTNDDNPDYAGAFVGSR